MHLISCRNVSKIFRRHTGQKLLSRHIQDLLFAPKQDRAEDRFYALRNVSFDVERGESVGIVGTNGAGKSTLLGLITGLGVPDAGSIEVNGRIAALLELGSGFHPDLTGRENVSLNAALLGFNERQLGKSFHEIVDFAGLSEVIDEPLRTYSSGMGMRLAFSVAVNLNPDILIIDEVLGVGDHAFQQRCLEKILHLRNSGTTLLCVSHSAASLQSLCNRAVWLDHGEVMMAGEIRVVLAAYEGRAVVNAES